MYYAEYYSIYEPYLRILFSFRTVSDGLPDCNVVDRNTVDIGEGPEEVETNCREPKHERSSGGVPDGVSLSFQINKKPDREGGTDIRSIRDQLETSHIKT